MVGIAHEAVEGGLVVAGGALLFVLLELLDDALHVGGEGLLVGVLMVLVDNVVGGVGFACLVEGGDDVGELLVFVVE